jgi:hypothetical protein
MTPQNNTHESLKYFTLYQSLIESFKAILTDNHSFEAKTHHYF